MNIHDGVYLFIIDIISTASFIRVKTPDEVKEMLIQYIMHAGILGFGYIVYRTTIKVILDHKKKRKMLPNKLN